MTENITRREFTASGIGGCLVALGGTALDKLMHEDMVPLDDLIQTNDKYQQIIDQNEQDHREELQQQFANQIQALRECMEGRK